jgi:hypothetical protein
MKMQTQDLKGKKITRKEAIKKAGFMAASTATAMILLNKNSHAEPATSGGGNNGWGNGDQDAPGGSLPNNNAENGPNKGNS